MRSTSGALSFRRRQGSRMPAAAVLHNEARESIGAVEIHRIGKYDRFYAIQPIRRWQPH